VERFDWMRPSALLRERAGFLFDEAIADLLFPFPSPPTSSSSHHYPHHHCKLQRIFNMTSQSEKSDPNGDYIRYWVPELKSVKGKAIHEPSASMSEKEILKLGYVMPIVDHATTRKVSWVPLAGSAPACSLFLSPSAPQRALARYKE